MKYEKRKEKELFNIRAKSQAIWKVAPRAPTSRRGHCLCLWVLPSRSHCKRIFNQIVQSAHLGANKHLNALAPLMG